MKNLRRILLMGAMALTASTALAQNANPLASRESKVPPFVSWMQSQGVKLTFLGEEGGLRGYLAESANGKMQTLYVAPDGEYAVGGILFKKGGTNITGIQIGEMRARFDAAANSLGSEKLDGTASDAGATAAESPSSAEPIQTSPVASPATEQAIPQGEMSSVDRPSNDVTPPSPAATRNSGEPSLSLPAADGPVAGALGNTSELWISKINKEEFLKAAESTPYFEVGTMNAPVTLWMVADPQCPYCHRAWDYLRPSVYAKKLKIRVILIAGLEGSAPIAQEILSRPLPARVWLDSDAGKNFTPTADPNSPEFAKASEFLAMNMDFAKKFGIDRTPFLGYTGPDGQFYSALGLPGDLDSFFAASGIN